MNVRDQVTHPLQQHQCFTSRLIKQLRLKRTSFFIALLFSCSLLSVIVDTWQVWVITRGGKHTTPFVVFYLHLLHTYKHHHCRLNQI